MFDVEMHNILHSLASKRSEIINKLTGIHAHTILHTKYVITDPLQCSMKKKWFDLKKSVHESFLYMSWQFTISVDKQIIVFPYPGDP